MWTKMDFKSYLILLITFMTIEFNVIESSRYSERRRSKYERKVYSPYLNICDIEDHVSKVHCYCENLKVRAATRADCWVFNGGIEEDDPFWSNFYSQPNIERLTFTVRTDGGLAYIPSKVIVRLEKLQKLNMHYANISTVPPFAFTNSSTLKDISLPKNKIEKLEKMAFSHLIMLVNLSLVDNQIFEVKLDVFYMLPNLQRLFLSKNIISMLHDGCFKHLSNLVRLELDSNLLTVVTKDNFQGLSNLITLDMRNNKLMMIGDLALSELWALQELYLDGNEIEFISERGFGGLTELRKLSLSDNKLATLDAGALDYFEKLTVLDLRNNNLETLKLETMQSVMENMKSNYALISLEGNKLTCDCRLLWLRKLKNETRSKRIKFALERLSCIADLKLHNKQNDIPKNTITPIQDYVMQKIDNDNYDDIQDDTNDGNKVEYRKRLLEIPPEMLPCKNRKSYGDSLSPSIEDEVRFYNSMASGLIVTITLKISILANFVF